MKALKMILAILALLVVVLLITAWLLPSSTYTERSMLVKATPETIFAQVNDLQRFQDWSPFLADDSTATLSFGEITSGPGASYSWESKMGIGTMSISESNPSTFVRYDLMFEGNRAAYSTLSLEAVTDSGTRVTWGFGVPELGWPIGRFIGLFMNSGMHPYMDKGLESLKALAEGHPLRAQGRTGEIAVEERTAQPILAVRDSVDMQGMEAFFGESYGIIMEYLGAKELQPTGPPMSITLFWNETGKSLIEAAIPTAAEEKPGKGVLYARTIPASKVVRASHFGPYHTVGMTYTAVEAFMTAEGYLPAGPPMEIYVTDPGTQPDTALWETLVVWPVTEGPKVP
ncbi:MAG TPA: SRPBCC family protein [Bacteroidales bacterium]|nr:SRPBCC family protein [Bacteroidales bacterium]